MLVPNSVFQCLNESNVKCFLCSGKAGTKEERMGPKTRKRGTRAEFDPRTRGIPGQVKCLPQSWVLQNYVYTPL